MYGAILGDIIGSPYEFDRGDKTKDFPLFSDGSVFTDDSVMTIAVAEALMDTMGKSDEEIKTAVAASMRRWGRKYPNAGYGAKFIQWLCDEEKGPYYSCGNGSAMRASAAGWLFDTVEETRRIARLTAEVTHNHPEGIKGAESTAIAIFLARNGASKKEIKDYIIREFGYDLSRSCDEIRPEYYHIETCQKTVPEAITAFLEGKNFEDAIRTAVSLGGDCDTLACITGSVSEAFFGVPIKLELECKERIDEEMKEVLDRFDAARGINIGDADPGLDGNIAIEEAIERMSKEISQDNLIDILESIRKRMHEDAKLIIPVVPPQEAFDMLDPDKVKVGDTIQSKEQQRYKLCELKDREGKTWLAAFTSMEELRKGTESSVMIYPMDDAMKGFAKMDQAEGVVLNPWGTLFMLRRPMIQAILDADKPRNRLFFRTGDITGLDVDAIVNAAKKSLLGGSGVDGAIHRAAGPKLLEECRKLGGCETGQAKITKGYDLKARHVIHTVGPVYSGRKEDEELLASCYRSSLELAKQNGLHSIAFPAISTGIYGYPKEAAARTALAAVTKWFNENPYYGMDVTMCCYSQEMYDIYQEAVKELS